MQTGQRLGGTAFIDVVRDLETLDPALADSLVSDGYGTVMSRGGLPLDDRELTVVAALACQGYLPQLKWHVAAALNVGVPPTAIREALIQVVPFAGWPSALNSLKVMQEVFEQRGVALKKAEIVVKDRETLRERGLQRGGEVYANYLELERSIADYDGELATYLTEHSYGQIYDRPGLSMRQRELIAVAMLTVQQRLPQLAAHLKGAHRVGATPDETKEVIVTMLLYAGWPPVLNALGEWKRVR
jgi:4-carboxymuconolactone decarboxylase